jgi:hypothetical protein
MPKLLTSPKKRKKVPPCGRVIQYNAPWSPWQKLVDSQRRRLGLSFADLANSMEDGNRGSVWIWIHSTHGYPSPESFTPRRAAPFYKILKIDPAEGAKALDASRHIYTPKEAPEPFPTREAFELFIEEIEQLDQRRVKTETVLNIARRIHAGLTASLLHDLRSKLPAAPVPAPGPAPHAPRAKKRV